METLITHCAGMDVHQETIVVCTITGSSDESPSVEVRTFSTMTRSLFELLQWLESKEITHVALESTGIYWRPVYNILEGYLTLLWPMLNVLKMSLVARPMFQTQNGLPNFFDMD